MKNLLMAVVICLLFPLLAQGQSKAVIEMMEKTSISAFAFNMFRLKLYLERAISKDERLTTRIKVFFDHLNNRIWIVKNTFELEETIKKFGGLEERCRTLISALRIYAGVSGGKPVLGNRRYSFFAARFAPFGLLRFPEYEQPLPEIDRMFYLRINLTKLTVPKESISCEAKLLSTKVFIEK